MHLQHKSSRAAGGIIAGGRLGGSLAISRALGDFLHKKGGLICTPEVIRIPIERSHQYLIIATDGLWDVLSNQEVLDIVIQYGVKDGPGVLVATALGKGSMDNVTVTVIKFN